MTYREPPRRITPDDILTATLTVYQDIPGTLEVAVSLEPSQYYGDEPDITIEEIRQLGDDDKWHTIESESWDEHGIDIEDLEERAREVWA